MDQKPKASKMDSITKKILFESGLYPGNPTLPPVNNVGMVYIKEPMLKQAEMDLFDARVALRDFEDVSKSTGLTASIMELEDAPDDEEEDQKKKRESMLAAWKNLFESLKKLEKAEGQYFVKRYGAGLDTSHRRALQGWVVNKTPDLPKHLTALLVRGIREMRAKFEEITKDYDSDSPTVLKFAQLIDMYEKAVHTGSVTASEHQEFVSTGDDISLDGFVPGSELRNQLTTLMNELNSQMDSLLDNSPFHMPISRADLAKRYDELDDAKVSDFVENFFSSWDDGS